MSPVAADVRIDGCAVIHAKIRTLELEAVFFGRPVSSMRGQPHPANADIGGYQFGPPANK